MTRFIVVPQWQGSPSARAMALADGAEAICGDLPRAAVTRIEVPCEAGESLDTGVRRASSLIKVRRLLGEALVSETDRVIIVGGDCSVAIAGVDHVASPDLAVVWFDAHADLNNPESSQSGAFSGMAARALLGDGPDRLTLTPGTLTPGRLFFAGVRALDDAEAVIFEGRNAEAGPTEASAARLFSPTDLADPSALIEAIRSSGATRVYIHVDLDVVDPAHISGVHNPVPFGLEPRQLTEAISSLRSAFDLVGASVAGFAPTSPHAAIDDLGTILRVIGSLAATS